VAFTLRLALSLVLTLGLVACSGSGSTTAPSTTTSTVATSIAGNWTGVITIVNPPATFKSGSPPLFNMSLTQTSTGVTGVWTSPGNYTGQVSGTLTATSFSGTLNYNGGEAASACGGSSAAVSGTLASTGKSLVLSSTGFSGESACRSGAFTIEENK
jgi:hypothetical protein